MLTKICKVCKVEKSIGEFHKNDSGKYGVRPECKECKSKKDEAYRNNNKDLIRKKKKEYYEANRKTISEKHKSYYDAHRAEISSYKKKYGKTYREINQQALSAYGKAYRDANKEAVLIRQRQWRQANPDKSNARSAKYRARKIQALQSWVDKEAIEGMYYLAALFRQTGLNVHVDHIVPLQSDTVCGLHCEANLQLLPGNINQSKGNRHWPDMW